MTDIRIPKLNANDLSYTLVEWLVAEGAPVRAGDPVVVVETAKATEELESPADGFLHRAGEVGAEYEVGTVIGTLSPGPAAPPAEPSTQPSAAPPDDVIITGPAAEFMAQHGIDRDAALALGRRLIRRSDLEPLVRQPPAADPVVTSGSDADPLVPQPSEVGPSAAPAGRVVRLARRQEAVAAVVAESHRTIPAAFVAVAVTVDGALILTRHLTRRHKRLVGLAELLVKAVAAQAEAFPAFFGTLLTAAADGHPAGTAVRVPDAINIGVTIDVGTGLQVPVVREPARLSWRELAGTLMDFRLTALRGTFPTRDLSGGSLVVALHNDASVTVAIPIVFPGQVCAVSLGAVQPGLDLDDTGTPVRRQTVQIGLSYDHRVVNGRDAVLFLAAVKALLEDPERLAALGEPPDTTGTNSEPQPASSRA